MLIIVYSICNSTFKISMFFFSHKGICSQLMRMIACYITWRRVTKNAVKSRIKKLMHKRKPASPFSVRQNLKTLVLNSYCSVKYSRTLRATK